MQRSTSRRSHHKQQSFAPDISHRKSGVRPN
jgi:hypothetical protein